MGNSLFDFKKEYQNPLVLETTQIKFETIVSSSCCVIDGVTYCMTGEGDDARWVRMD